MAKGEIVVCEDKPAVPVSDASLKLSVAVQQELSALKYPDRATSLLAQLAGVELASAVGDKSRLEWFDRCRSLAKEGRAKASDVNSKYAAARQK